MLQGCYKDVSIDYKVLSCTLLGIPTLPLYFFFFFFPVKKFVVAGSICSSVFYGYFCQAAVFIENVFAYRNAYGVFAPKLDCFNNSPSTPKTGFGAE